MFAFSAVSVGKLKEMQNGGNKTRRGIDAWDRVRGSYRTACRIAANQCTAKYDLRNDLMSLTKRPQ
jgi:hypothetical protein